MSVPPRPHRGAFVARFRTAGEQNLVAATLSWLVCLGFAWVLLWILLDPMRPFEYFARAWTWVGALAVVALMHGVARWGRRPVDWLERHARVRRGIGIGALAAAAIVMVRLGMAVRFPPGWDAGAVEDWGHGLAHGHRTAEDHAVMAARYPNNLSLVGWLARWYQFCDLLGVSSMGMGTVLLNVLALGGAVVLMWTLARRVAGPMAGYVVLVPAVPLVVVSPWIGVAYSDTLGTVFPIGIVLLFLVARDTASARVQVLCWTGVGLLGLVGYRIKPTVVFALLAVLAGVLLELRRRGGWRAGARRLGYALAGVAVGATLASVVLGVVVGRTGIMPGGEEKDLAMPLTHFLMMGAGYQENQETFNRAWGGWNGADVELTESVPPEERFEHSFEVWVDRVQAWGPVGYPRFLNEKATWMLGDGNFNAFRHGYMSNPDRPWEFHDPLSRELRTWMTPHHEQYRWLALVRQSVWFGVLLLLVAPAFWWRRRIHGVAFAVMRLSVAGLFAFLLLFEGGSRYLYLYVPLVLVLAAVTTVEWATARDARRAPGTETPTAGGASTVTSGS